MPIKLARSRVPIFSKSSLDLADLCARDLWRGKVYSSNALQVSEEELLMMFSSPFINNAIGLKNEFKGAITTAHVDQFIKVAGLSSNKRFSNDTLNLKKGISTIDTLVASRIKAAFLNVFNVDFHTLSTDLTEHLANDFFKADVRRKKGSFVPLASRLLFFTAPNIPILNYSSQIAENLGLTKSPLDNLVEYNAVLVEGLNNNWDLLKEYQMPFLTQAPFNDELWLIARNNGWWQRRVFDIAIMNYFNIQKPRQDLLDLCKTYPAIHP